MSDIAVGGIAATDILALGGDWHPQTQNLDSQLTRESAKGATGDEVASASHGAKTQGSVTYIYTGAGTLGIIDMSGLAIGKVLGGQAVDSITAAFSNNTWPTFTIGYHNHTANEHADGSMVEITPTVDLPAGFGCADLFTNAGATSSCVSASYTLSAEHKDVDDSDGNHLAGDYFGATETVTAQYYGVPTLTTTGFVVTSSNASDSNADFDQVNISATRGIARDA